MRKVLEFVMDAEEYGAVTNIVSSQEKNASMMADKLLREEIPKERIADFLYSMATELSSASNILTDI